MVIKEEPVNKQEKVEVDYSDELKTFKLFP
jgi:hypothetical protein